MAETSGLITVAETSGETTKRRLAPQFSFKADDSYENAKGKSSSNDAKKSVVRFTREMIIAMRKSSKMLDGLSRVQDIIVPDAQDPVCFTTLEPEQVIQIWQEANRENAKSRNTANRSRPSHDDEGGGHDRRHSAEDKDLWDSGADMFNGESFDFSKVAEESSRFRTELDRMKNSGLDTHSFVEEDAMSALMKESGQENSRLQVDDEEEDGLAALSIAQPAASQRKVDFNSLLLGGNSYSGFDQTSSTASSSLLSKIGVQLEGERVTAAPKPSPAPPAADPEWLYRDPQQQIQGPFSQQNMYLWNREGYFSSDLPIKLTHWSDFYSFAVIFPVNEMAFTFAPPEPLPAPTTTNAPKPKPAVANPTIASASEVRVEVATKPVVAAPAPVVTVPDVDRSNFAKKLLGIATPTTPSSTENVSKQAPAASSSSSNTPGRSETVHQQQPDTAEQAPKKGWNKKEAAAQKSQPSSSDLAAIQREQLENDAVNARSTPAEAAAPAAAKSTQLKSFLGIKAKATEANSSPVAATAPKKGAVAPQLQSQPQQSSNTKVWSAPPAPVETSGKSLKEIMDEEMIQRKVEESVADSRPQGSSWASKARANGSAPALTAMPVVAPVIAARKLEERPGDKASNDSKRPVSEVKVAAPGGSASRNTASDFGGKKMNKEIADWCLAQLRKLNGPQDLSLMEFCMSIDSAVEVRETLSSYLGSTAQVTNFATEFIRYKDEGKRPASLGIADTASSAEPKAASAVNAGNSAGGFQVNIKKKKSVK